MKQVWEYQDVIGIKRIGYYVAAIDEGRTYQFDRKDGSGIDLVSGQRLIEAKRIGAE